MTDPDSHASSRSAGDGDGAGPLADWGLAERVAITAATAAAPRIPSDEAEALRSRLHRIVAETDPVARRVTGLGEDLAPAEAVVVGRASWIRANIATLAWLTNPIADQLLRRAPGARALARRAVGAQIGMVLGYLASRVLGQYEVLRPDLHGQPAPGRLLLVGPNLRGAARLAHDEGLDPTEFERGVVLHELAHRVQFEAVSWLRPYLQELLDEYFADARIDAERVREMVSRLPEVLSDPSRATDPRRWMALVLTPAQMDVLDRAQSLMTLLEGHGNATMDWGAESDAAFDPAAVRKLLQRRRGRMFDRVARDALGLSLKAQQYAVGERFVLDVAERHGNDTFNRVWEDPANLPRTDELDDPDRWVARITSG